MLFCFLFFVFFCVRFYFMVLPLQHKWEKFNLHNLSLFVVLRMSEVLNTILPLMKYRGI